MNKKSIISALLIIVMVFTMLFGFTGCSDDKEVIMPQLRINEQTNYWEVSYDNGDSWISMGVKATGEDGKDGADGKDGINGINGTNGVNGRDGTDGKDGKDGKDGVNGSNGQAGANGITPHIGSDGYWYVGDVCTNIYAGTTQKVTVTFKEAAVEKKVTTYAGSRVGWYLPECSVATFVNWYSDEACTKLFDFNQAITKDTTVYSKWSYDDTFKQVASLMEKASLGKASCFGTTACFNSSYFRVLTDDNSYYDGAAGIANYLKGVFTEENGKVTVSSSSALRRISYTDAVTVLNFASAFSSYSEYITRNNLSMPEDIASQKELAIKFFNTVDYKADGYNTHTGGGGLTFPSMSVTVVAMGSLMNQNDTDRFDTLIKAAYENVDASFWNSSMYLEPFYQLCAKYDWFDKSKFPEVTELTDASVVKYYAYGINVAKDYPEFWTNYVNNALSDGRLSVAEAKAFAYHYAYQLTGGDVYLGIYGGSRDIVDFSKM